MKSETGHPSSVALCKIYLFSRYTEKLLRVVFQFAYFDFAGKRWNYFFTPTRPRPVDERQLAIFYISSEWFGGKSQSRCSTEIPCYRKSACHLFWTYYFTRTLELLGECDQLKDLRKKQCPWGIEAFLAFSTWWIYQQIRYSDETMKISSYIWNQVVLPLLHFFILY